MIKKLIDLAQDFHNETLKKYSRYRSWHYCYRLFSQVRNKTNNDVDFLAIHLGFYLASWGMYRGSSFLLQKDYKIHIPVVEELLRPDYDVLCGIECDKLAGNLDLLLNLGKNIKDLYGENITDTLLTKILMGTLGCCPAYDRYFLDALRSFRRESVCNIQQAFNKNSMLGIIKFYQNNFIMLEEFRENNIFSEIMYPQMKVIDMAFWKYGFEINNKK